MTDSAATSSRQLPSASAWELPAATSSGGAGGHGGYGGAPASQPDNNLVWGILVTVLCCLPLGIVSIVKATQVSGLWGQGRYAEAQQAADDAKKFAMWGAIAGVVVGVIYLIFTLVVGASAFSYS